MALRWRKSRTAFRRTKGKTASSLRRECGKSNTLARRVTDSASRSSTTEDFKVIGHGGSDWSEKLWCVLLRRPSNDAVIVFLNAPNRFALSAMPEFLALLDPRSPYLVQPPRLARA